MDDRVIKTITTKSGREFEVAWCGISFIDELYFDLKSSTFQEALSIFGDAGETEELLYCDGRVDTKIMKYTDLQAIQKILPNGYIRVCLTVPAGT